MDSCIYIYECVHDDFIYSNVTTYTHIVDTTELKDTVEESKTQRYLTRGEYIYISRSLWEKCSAGSAHRIQNIEVQMWIKSKPEGKSGKET